jgi:hypothetical protein
MLSGCFPGSASITKEWVQDCAGAVKKGGQHEMREHWLRGETEGGGTTGGGGAQSGQNLRHEICDTQLKAGMRRQGRAALQAHSACCMLHGCRVAAGWLHAALACLGKRPLHQPGAA